MSQAKLAIVSVVSAFCLHNIALGNDPTELPILTTAEVQFVPSTKASLVSVLHENSATGVHTGQSVAAEVLESSTEAVDQDQTQLHASSMTSQRSPSDGIDATSVPVPKSVGSPITLGDLAVPNISLQNVGTGDIPDDATSGRMPASVPLPLAIDRGIFLQSSKQWVPGGFCHQPLYFEDAMLERHGHQRFPYLQPFVSAAKFYGTIPLAPYKWTLQRPLEDRHTLGSFRPGSPAPLIRQRLPYDEAAFSVQVGVSGATVVAIP